MDSKNNLHLLTRSALWAILPDRLPLLVTWFSSGFIPEWEAAKPHAIGRGVNKVAVIPVQGVLTKDGPSWLGSNYDGITEALENAGADGAIKHVVLAVDSPGGEVTGLPETAAALASVAKVKPVTAMVEGMAASAAYWLTSQAREIALTPSGEVGSVGVRMMHMDISKMLSDMGVSVTELQSGQFKTEWSPFKPLTDEAKTDMQQRLDTVHQDFLSAVSAGRGVRASQDMREGKFGEGRMFTGPVAVSNGLADRLQTSRDFYRSITPVAEPEPTQEHGLRRARLDLERKRF